MRAQPALEFAGGGRVRRPFECAASLQEVARRAAASDLSADARVLAAVVSLTAGWMRLTDAVVIDQVAELAGVHRDVARRTLRRLADTGAIVWRPVRGGRRSLLGLPAVADHSGPDEADHSGPLQADHSGPDTQGRSSREAIHPRNDGGGGSCAGVKNAPPEGLLEAVGRRLFTSLGGVGRRELYAAWAASPERVRVAVAECERVNGGPGLLVTKLRDAAAVAAVAVEEEVAAVDRRRAARRAWALREAQEAPSVAWFVRELDTEYAGLEAAERAGLIAEASTIIGGA